MRMSRMLQIAAAVLLLSGTVYAQAEKETPTGFYRLEFVTKELDDTKVINTRNYSMIVAENKQDGNSIRSSTRMPIPSGSNPSQYIYSDLGVNIDAQVGIDVLRRIAPRRDRHAGTRTDGVPILLVLRHNHRVVPGVDHLGVVQFLGDEFEAVEPGWRLFFGLRVDGSG